MTEEKQNIEEKKESAGKKSEQIAPNRKATVRGVSLPISTRHSIAICRFIGGKTLSQAISMLQDVIKFKKAVPMRGELPHRKGMCSGRYPVNASKQFVKLLKSLNANASNLSVDATSMIIHAKADLASRGRSSRKAKHFKRTNILIELKQK